MRTAIVLFVLLSAVPAAHAQTPSSLAATGASVTADVWTPLRVFVGTWAGESAGTKAKVRRAYEPVLNNQHLQVTQEARGGDAQPWGLISYDSWHKGFVLRHFSTDGTALDLAYDSEASTDKQLVFASAPDAAQRQLVTYRIVSWNEFVERVESGAPDASRSVTETHFKRK